MYIFRFFVLCWYRLCVYICLYVPRDMSSTLLSCVNILWDGWNHFPNKLIVCFEILLEHGFLCTRYVCFWCAHFINHFISQSWWRHQMETFSALLALCEGNSPVIGQWIPLTKASDAELWCFFDLGLNKRLSKQSWDWWFETPSRPLWRHMTRQLCCRGICKMVAISLSWMYLQNGLWICLNKRSHEKKEGSTISALAILTIHCICFGLGLSNPVCGWGQLGNC